MMDDRFSDGTSCRHPRKLGRARRHLVGRRPTRPTLVPPQPGHEPGTLTPAILVAGMPALRLGPLPASAG